jgi:hypothetical protein
MLLITSEVDKFLVAARVTAKGIKELDKKIALELYLMEKREAIADDLKSQAEDVKSQVDVESNLDRVRLKYRGLVSSMDAPDGFKSQSQAAKSQVGMSMISK